MRLYHNCSEHMDDDPNWLFKASTFLLHSDLELEQACDCFAQLSTFFGHTLLTKWMQIISKY